MPPFATVDKVKEGFSAASERMNEIESQGKLAFQEMQESLKTLAKQLQSITRAYMTGKTEAGEPYNRFWPDEQQAKSFGELILKALRRKAMGETVASEGGVLVPEELSTRLIQKLGQYGVFRRNTMVVPVGADRLIVPKVEADLTVYCPGEGKEIDESDMDFSQVGLNMHKLCCLCKASTELVEDAVIALGEIIALSMTRSMARKEDQIGFAGDGTEDYFGMTGIIGALLKVDDTIGNIKGLKVGSGNAYGELTLDDFEGVVSILPDDADAGAKWYVNRKFFFSVMYRLARAAGVADLQAILTSSKDRFFMGYGVEFTSAMPSTEANSQICAILGDLSLGSFLGERRMMQIEQSTDVYFKNDQIGFRGRERIDINAYGVGNTDEAGPIVALITAAS
jgi:HK97 family phage major capsid protein